MTGMVRVNRIAFDEAAGFDSAHVREPDVHQHQVGRRLPDQLQRLRSCIGFYHPRSRPNATRAFSGIACVGIIDVEYGYANLHRHHLSPLEARIDFAAIDIELALLQHRLGAAAQPLSLVTRYQRRGDDRDRDFLQVDIGLERFENIFTHPRSGGSGRGKSTTAFERRAAASQLRPSPASITQTFSFSSSLCIR